MFLSSFLMSKLNPVAEHSILKDSYYHNLSLGNLRIIRLKGIENKTFAKSSVPRPETKNINHTHMIMAHIS